MFRKILALIFLFLLMLLATGWYFSSTLLQGAVSAQLKKTLPDSQVSLKSCRWTSWRDIELGSLRVIGPAGDVEMEKMSVGFDWLKLECHGSFAIPKFSKQKIVATDLRGHFDASQVKATVRLDSAKFFDGILTGQAEISSFTPLNYQAHLTLDRMPVEPVMKNFEWDKKCQADGFLSGTVDIAATGNKLSYFQGQLLSGGGGNIVILDQEFCSVSPIRPNSPLKLFERVLKIIIIILGLSGYCLDKKILSCIFY